MPLYAHSDVVVSPEEIGAQLSYGLDVMLCDIAYFELSLHHVHHIVDRSSASAHHTVQRSAP
jgi:hypothetical protein